MRERWNEVLLGSVGDASSSKVKEYEGLRPYFDTSAIGFFGAEGDPTMVSFAERPSRANESRAVGDVGFAKMKGSVKVVEVVEGLESSIFSTGMQFIRPNKDVLPGFLKIIFQSPSFQMAKDSVTGDGIMASVKKADAMQIGFLLPPLPEQRRIVDLIGAIDDQIQSAEAVAAHASQSWESILATTEAEARETRTAGELLIQIEAGKSPVSLDRPPGPGERAVLKVSAVGRNRFDPLESKVLSDEIILPSGTEVSAGDILITRANGVLSRVGQVCIVRDQPEGLFISDKTLRLVPDTAKVDRQWFAYSLMAPEARKQIESLTTGSDMRNISQAAIRQIRVSLPPEKEQVRIAGLLLQLTELSESALNVAARAMAVRSALFSDLRSGNHEIPDSYDALLELAS